MKDAFSGRPIEPEDVAARYRHAMGATEHTLTWLVPLEDVEFSQDRLDCGGFEIRKFSCEELDRLLRNSARRIFFHHAYVDSAVLEPYWFLYMNFPKDTDYIGGVERGEHNIGLVNIVELAHALRVKPMKLLEPIR